jgi:hypothetical protein
MENEEHSGPKAHDGEKSLGKSGKNKKSHALRKVYGCWNPELPGLNLAPAK